MCMSLPIHAVIILEWHSNTMEVGGVDMNKGKQPVVKPVVEIYKHGQPLYIGHRNDPWVLQQPYTFRWWVYNNDIHFSGEH